MVPPGKRALALSEEVSSKRDSVADYWIIEDELDDERRASRLWQKIPAECAERGTHDSGHEGRLSEVSL